MSSRAGALQSRWAGERSRCAVSGGARTRPFGRRACTFRCIAEGSAGHWRPRRTDAGARRGVLQVVPDGQLISERTPRRVPARVADGCGPPHSASVGASPLAYPNAGSHTGVAPPQATQPGPHAVEVVHVAQPPPTHSMASSTPPHDCCWATTSSSRTCSVSMCRR